MSWIPLDDKSRYESDVLFSLSNLYSENFNRNSSKKAKKNSEKYQKGKLMLNLKKNSKTLIYLNPPLFEWSSRRNSLDERVKQPNETNVLFE